MSEPQRRSFSPGLGALRASLGPGAVRGYASLLAFLLAGYFASIFTPLRLHPDSVVMLSMADSAAHGEGFLFAGKPTVFPVGYPAFAALLLKLQLPYVWALITLNFVMLCAGFAALFVLLYGAAILDARSAVNVCILGLSSFVFIKHFPIPLTDICFFGLAMITLTLMESASSLTGSRLIYRILLCALLVGLSLTVRRIGISLVVPWVWIFAAHPQIRSALRSKGSSKTVVLTSGAASLAAIIAVVSRTSTLSDWLFPLVGAPPLDAAWEILSARLMEVGEIAVNLPRSAFPVRVQTALLLPGSAALLLSFWGMMRGSRLTPVKLFVLTYIAIIFVWPYYDPRFWLPVIPLLFAFARVRNAEIASRHPSAATAAIAYGMAFVVIGFVVQLGSARISFSGERFPAEYREGIYSSAYCSIYPACTDAQRNLPRDLAGERVLRTFR